MSLVGLSAFPLTPHRGGAVDLEAFTSLVETAVGAGVDSIGALGSTGGYAYLERADRVAVAERAVGVAGAVPVVIGVGAISTSAVLRNVEDATSAGAAGVLLAPVSYQPLRDDEVFGLFADVTARFPDMPVVVYDNPATTGFTFSTDLLVRVAELPSVTSIKLGSIAADPDEARAGIAALRERVGADVTLGISGDGQAARGLLAGCDVWYSVIAGLFPVRCVAIARAARSGDAERALALSDELADVWALFARRGSFRVAAALATLMGRTAEDAVYAPVRALAGADRDAAAHALAALERG
jgi:4-hydroxy-tetrahydrodipicolinate synthase